VREVQANFWRVLLPQADPGNEDYRKCLMNLIAGDCLNGKHKGEYVIDAVD
jgi:hypothetical protein